MIIDPGEDFVPEFELEQPDEDVVTMPNPFADDSDDTNESGGGGLFDKITDAIEDLDLGGGEDDTGGSALDVFEDVLVEQPREDDWLLDGRGAPELFVDPDLAEPYDEVEQDVAELM